ncbi:MAG: glycosyltransferase family 39 protein [Patescibacteria group bacterium]
MLEEQIPRKTVRQFFSEHVSIIVFLATIIFVIIFSVSTLVTKPRLWIDEAISISIARSFLTHGVLSPQISPNTFFEPPAFIQSTGYPVTISLAGFFKIFGYGIYQARTFMVLWILILLSAVFFLAKKLFSKEQAWGSLLLIASFASFYGSGRTVVGEIPGFAFLLAGFYFLLEKQKYFVAGLLWGLAVVAKPSVFGLIIPAIVVTFLFEWRGFFRKILMLGLGMIPAGLLWILILIPKPFTSETWIGLSNFYKNPFSSSISENVANNLAGFFHSSTLIYFGLFFLLIVGARIILKEEKLKPLFTFTLIYSVLAFIYYLRSPGWLRYILIAELLILFILPKAIALAVSYFKEKFQKISISEKLITSSILGILIVFQFVQMFTVAQVFFGDDDLKMAQYIEEKFPGETIGLLNALELSVLLDPSYSYLTFYNAGLPIVGENPVLMKVPPEVIVTDPNNQFAKAGEKVLREQYVEIPAVHGYSVYTRTKVTK